jgi:hypothetical protein
VDVHGSFRPWATAGAAAVDRTLNTAADARSPAPDEPVPAGTTAGSSSVRYGIVKKPWERPAG